MVVKADQPDPSTIDLEAMPHWRCSSERYLELIGSGEIGPGDKIELINGMVTAMSPAGPEHDYAIMQLHELLIPLIPRYRVINQSTIHLDEGQIFDPDIAVLKRRDGDAYKHQHPGADDILLIIEVAASSMKRDAQVKMPIYAQAGIPEYWVADIENRMLIVHRDPTDNGYGLIQKFSGDTLVEPISVSGLSITPISIFA
ncbi:MAG: Uma2 family endonuclease [Planctomycetota bacterium]